MSDTDQSELETTEEIDETPYVEYDISVSPSDPTLELLAAQLEKGDIFIPFYQRKFVWKIEQASKLIESFLMGLPVPQVFLYVNSDEKLEVIDGQQRLLSVKYFFEGYFGVEDSKGNRKVFKLKGLSQRSEYNGKAFDELNPRDQRKLRNTPLRAINIKQLKPSSDGDSVFHIFERLNTGGTQLKPQEIRNAVYRGNIVNELKALNVIEAWQEILGLSKPDKSQKDLELVLRLFSLFNRWQKYEKPMLRHLNRFMDANREFSSPDALLFKTRFQESTEMVNRALNRPFRPKKVLNSAVMESVMIAVLENKDITEANLKQRYTILLKDDEFLNNISGATTDTILLHNRIRIAKRILENGAC